MKRLIFLFTFLIIAGSGLFLSLNLIAQTKKTSETKTSSFSATSATKKPTQLAVPIKCDFENPCIKDIKFPDAPYYQKDTVHFNQDRVALTFDTIPSQAQVLAMGQQIWMLSFKMETKSGDRWVPLGTRGTWQQAEAQGSPWRSFSGHNSDGRYDYHSNPVTADGEFRICVKNYRPRMPERCYEYTFTVPATKRNAKEEAKRQEEIRRQQEEAARQAQSDAERRAAEERQAEIDRQRQAEAAAEQRRQEEADRQGELATRPAVIRAIRLHYLDQVKSFTSTVNAEGYHYINEWVTLPNGQGRRLFSVSPNEPYWLSFEVDEWEPRLVQFYFACEYQETCNKNPNLAANENTRQWINLNPQQQTHVQMRQNRCQFNGVVQPYIYVCIKNTRRSDADRNLSFCTASDRNLRGDQCWKLKLFH